MAHHAAGRLEQAEAVLRRMAAGKNGDPDGRGASLLAMILALQGRNEQAEHFFKRALALRPHSPALRANFGNMLLLTGRLAEAKSQFEAALAVDPAFAAALIGLAPVLHQLGDGDGAVDAGRRAVAASPLDASATLNLASALGGAGYVHESLAVLREALELDPGNTKLITNYLMSRHYRWPDQDLDDDAEELWEEHHVLGARFGRDGAPGTARPARSSTPPRTLRVGLLSSDLRHHVVATFLRPILEHRDRATMHVTAYHTGALDHMSRTIEGLVDSWRWVALDGDDALERRIRADRLDVIIDLNGHTEGSRVGLLARRLAPLQATYLGYPDTTGVPEIDVRIVDADTDPLPTPGNHDRATERLVRLPRCFLCYQAPADAPSAILPPSLENAEAAPERPVTFASFNAAPKVNDRLLRLWARVLKASPGSRLLLKNRALASPKRCAEVQAVFAAQGIEPARLALMGWHATASAHLSQYHLADIALDAFPYHGTTTTCEALWMGVPVVTLAGVAHVSRVGVSLLRAAGLSDLVASTEDEYVAIAARLASDVAALRAGREALRVRVSASPLCDGPAMARTFEDALRGAWIDTSPEKPA